MEARTVEIPEFIRDFMEHMRRREVTQFVHDVYMTSICHQTRKILKRLAEQAGIVMSDEQNKRIEACTDVAMLERWTDNVIHAKTAAEVFGH